MQVAGIGSVHTTVPKTDARREGTSFGEMLTKAIDSVNRQELEAQRAALLLASGEITDIHTVTIAAQKAELALDLALAVRNKVLEAYQEVMRMQV